MIFWVGIRTQIVSTGFSVFFLHIHWSESEQGKVLCIPSLGNQIGFSRLVLVTILTWLLFIVTLFYF